MSTYVKTIASCLTDHREVDGVALKVATHQATVRELLEEPEPSKDDRPSYLYVAAFIANSAILMWLPVGWALIPFILIQAGFFIGLLELMHQSVHRNFVMNRKVNEVLGGFAASLIGYNLISYRYFHLEHHRHTCDELDPEGILYAHSPETRWSALITPLAHIWVAFSINKLSTKYVPKSRQQEWRRCGAFALAVWSSLGLFAAIAPQAFVAAYLIPFCLFAYIDSFFSQAEHYDTTYRKPEEKIDVSLVSYDIKLPTLLSHLVLSRNLHRIHHVWPRTRWFEAPNRLETLNNSQQGRTMSFPVFIRKWLKGGPRLWLPTNSLIK